MIIRSGLILTIPPVMMMRNSLYLTTPGNDDEK